MQTRNGAENRCKYQRHNNHLQQLDITVADNVEPLYGIFKNLAVGTINGVQGKAEHDTHDQTDQYFFGQTPLFVPGLRQHEQQHYEHDNVRD